MNVLAGLHCHEKNAVLFNGVRMRNLLSV